MFRPEDYSISENVLLKATPFLKENKEKMEGHTGVYCMFNIFYLKSDRLL